MLAFVLEQEMKEITALGFVCLHANWISLPICHLFKPTNLFDNTKPQDKKRFQLLENNRQLS